MKVITLLSLLLLLLNSCQPPVENQPQEPEILSRQDSLLYRSSPDPDVVHPTVIRVYDKLNFGNGYNSTTGEEYFGVLNFEGTQVSTELTANARGNRGSVTMEILESKDQLKESLNITAKADLDLKIFGVTSNNSLKVSTFQDTEFSEFQQNAVLKAHYVNEPLVLINPTVKEELVQLARSDPETFMRTCGDMFVSRIYTGGQLYALFSLNSRDTNEKKQNELFFQSANSYLGNSLTVSVDATKIQERISNVKNINTTVITEGGASTPQTTEIEDYIKYANQFKEQVSADQRAVILYVELSPYESIAGFPKLDFSKIRVRQRSYLQSCMALLNLIEEGKHNAEFVQENTDIFEDEDVAESLEVIAAYEDRTMLLRKLLADCEADPDYCHLRDLELFQGIEPFNPHIDLPEWEGEQTKLPLVADGNWVTVSANTEDGKVLSIQGDLQVRLNVDDDPDCHSGEYDPDRMVYGQELTYKAYWFWENDQYQTVYLNYTYPYYRVRYISKETGQVVKEFNWTGPVNTEPNVEVQITLKNPVARLQYLANDYHNLGDKREEALGYTKGPRYPIIQSCDAALPPTAVIAVKGAEPVATKAPLQMAASTGPGEERPQVVAGREGVYAYKYIEEERSEEDK